MKKGAKFWLFNDRFLPPSCDELQEYFDNYDDIIDHLNNTGEFISTVPTIADSSDDSLEGFSRRYHAGGGALFGRRLRDVERERHERALREQAYWREREREQTPEYVLAPPPPRRPAIDPFNKVRRRKMLIYILEKTRRIREELQRRHDAGAEEYLR